MSKDLEVRHCRVLVAIEEQGGIAAAGRSLRLAQSTVSETLLSLERVVGAPILLRRPGREAALSAAALALLPYARALILASETARASVATNRTGLIRLGVVESISSFLLPAPLANFRLTWPGVDVRIAIGLCADLRRRLRQFELDAALTLEGAERAAEGAETRKWLPAQLRLVVSPRSPLVGKAVGRADLAGTTFLLTDPDGAFNALLKRWFGERAPPLRIESAGSIDGVKRGVLASDAIGVLPAYAVAEELRSGTLAALKTSEPLPPIALLLSTAEPLLPSLPLHNLITHIDHAFGRMMAA